jgi:hypothetical protein
VTGEDQSQWELRPAVCPKCGARGTARAEWFVVPLMGEQPNDLRLGQMLSPFVMECHACGYLALESELEFLKTLDDTNPPTHT